MVGLRLVNFEEQFRFIPDNGSEHAIARQISLSRCLPLVGPTLSIDKLYTPPTYFYYKYLITGGIFNPIFTGYISALLKILSIIFLAATVWLITNRRAFLVSLFALSWSWLLFTKSRFTWHPNQVSLFISISVFLLTYAKIKRHWLPLVGSFLMYWLAASIYPSPIVLMPWYLFEIIRWPRPPKRQWWAHLMLGLGMFFATALPFYAPQLIFEIQHKWQSLQTLQHALSQNTSQSAGLERSSLSEFYHFLLIEVLFIRDDWKSFTFSWWFILVSTTIIGIASVYKQSHRWQLYFPYLPGGVLLGLFLVLNSLLPGQLHQHWLSLFFIIFIPSLIEAIYKLWALVPLRVIGLLLCGVIWINNAYYYWESFVTPPPVPEQLIQKTHRMEYLKSFWLNKNLRPKSILVLDRNPDVTYTDTYVLQYSAMENWTLLNYQTLLPPISPACNEYAFFEEPEIQLLAKNIFLLEATSAPESPDTLFSTFEKKLGFNLDESKRATWYVNLRSVD